MGRLTGAQLAAAQLCLGMCPPVHGSCCALQDEPLCQAAPPPAHCSPPPHPASPHHDVPTPCCADRPRAHTYDQTAGGNTPGNTLTGAGQYGTTGTDQYDPVTKKPITQKIAEAIPGGCAGWKGQGRAGGREGTARAGRGYSWGQLQWYL